MERRGRRRLRSEDAVLSNGVTMPMATMATGAGATGTPVVSAAEAAATLEFLDELGEFLEIEQPSAAAAATPSALEPIPFETGYGSSQSSPMSSCELTEQQHLNADRDEDEDEAVVVKPVKKTKKSSTQRQKEELTYLRTKVGQLERELKDMKTVFLGSSLTQESQEDVDGALSSSSSLATHFSARNSTSMWESMAQRQLREKNRAELENVQLKEAMEVQIKLAKGLERMLRKRQVWDEMQEPIPFDIVVEQESEIYAFMRKSIEARIPLVDTIFEDERLFGQGCVQKSEANTVHSDSEGLHVEFIEARTIPFDFRATARMTWKHMGTKNPKLKTIAVNTLLMEQTEDSLMTKHLVTTVTAGEKRTTTTRSEYRRIQYEDHVLMVWHSIMENKGKSQSEKSGIHITLQGCSKIAKAETKDGAVATTVFSFVHMTPKFANSSVANSDLLCGTSLGPKAAGSTGGNMQLRPQSNAGGVFTEVMITSFQQNVHMVQQAIENDLMDEFFEQRRAQCEIISL